MEEQQRAQEALRLLDGYLRAHPGDAGVHLAAARLGRRQHLWERAYAEARTVTQLEPGNALAWQLYGQAAAMTERPQEAEPALKKAFALDPRSWETETSMGDLFVHDKKYAEAVPYYREAIRLAPDKAVPYLSLGQALLKSAPSPASLAEAEKALLRCQSLRPDIPQCSLYLGQCYARQQRWKEAKEALETAREHDPANMDVYFELGKVYSQLKDERAAGRAFERHEQLVILNDERRVSLARIERLERDGRRDAADRVRLELASKLAKNAMYDEAIGHYQVLLSHHPERADLRRALALAEERGVHPDLLVQRGADLLHQKRYADAARIFHDALSRDKACAPAWEGLGTALAATGDSNGAIRAFLTATRLDPNLPWAELGAGEAYAQIGLLTEARRRLRIAESNAATRQSARDILQNLSTAGKSNPLADYAQVSLRLLRHPNDARARNDASTAERRLRASGDLPPKDVMEPLLQSAVSQ